NFKSIVMKFIDNKLKRFLLLLIILFSPNLFSQEKNITGKVVDQEGIPLPGVSIILEGTSNATSTDMSGDFEISAVPGQTIRFSFVGFKDQKAEVGENNHLKIVMKE